MSDVLDTEGSSDRGSINVNETWELSYWSKELGVTEDQLKEAVTNTDASAEAVRIFLQK